ncbi:GNAT superfamily N-acetyltransferase [Kibdelosporangium banguiense]|uniref:GNAT superfamily N-acetyltransferase n=1 Tax=Kibdelosporangium banguiense TaxID=1365924 RepID=A0ABS4TKQ8_9PSEU|nr:GNAT family N-acetyltransferase [Kibdelosporangium banguiense]MBP2324503.1 GNAT superfamily N-acetyltransferase [Kibdelosporangium banguiense]
MKFTDGLVDTQSAWFARLDPMLPAAVRPPDGDVITAALPDGSRAAGVVVASRLAPDAMPTLWSALEVWELHPMLGEHGMAELMAQWQVMMDRRAPGPDSSCLVTWPSRDVRAARVLLDHGLVPLSTLAIRTGGRTTPSPGRLTIRRARLRDLDVVFPLAMAELEYSAMVGGTVLRPGALKVKREALARHLDQNDPVWLAESDGIAVALAECWFSDSEAGSWSETRVRHGLWGYINSFSVAPPLRGTGIGRELIAHVHRELGAAGTVGTFLYFNPPNPLSTVFWARQGYRPLWTIWEVRPASALR